MKLTHQLKIILAAINGTKIEFAYIDDKTNWLDCEYDDTYIFDFKINKYRIKKERK